MVFAGNVHDAWRIKQEQKKPFMALDEKVRETLIFIAKHLVENEPDLADFRTVRWAKLG